MKIFQSEMGPVFQYESIEELTYNLLNCIGLSVRADGKIIDTELNTYGGAEVKLSGKSIKASIDPNNIHYAGEGEVMLDILTNYKVMNEFFGFFLDKKKAFDGQEALTYYPTDTEDDKGNKICCMNVKFVDNSVVSSEFFYNRCLTIVDMIFKIGECNVDVHNFDVISN